MNIPKLLAPASEWPMLTAAVEAGCDEIYLGIKELNMRATAKNFEINELPKIVEFCHASNVKVNLTLNTIIFDEELEKVDKVLDAAKKAGVDAIICWDIAVMQKCKEKGLDFHVSTQASIANSEAAKFFKEQGASRIISARECTLEQLRKIKENVDIEIEAFGHGAMCVSVSGRCFLSQQAFGRSANKGDCLQPCRRKYEIYKIKDVEGECEYELGEDYVLSPKDLCVLPFLDKLSGVVDVIKIEGRARSPEYVKVVVECYREAIDAIASDKFTDELKDGLMKKLSTVFNRGFSSGFYMGRLITEFSSPETRATKQKIYVGHVKNFFNAVSVAEVKIESGKLNIGDEIMIQGYKSGVFSQKLQSMQINGKNIDKAEKGMRVGINLERKARENDKLFLIKSVL